MNVVILKHTFYESPYYILKIIKSKKISYKIINIYKGEILPEINTFDFLIIMGGPMGVYEEDKYPWLKKEKYFIKIAIKNKKKILGICLGAQLLAECLGGRVFKNKYKEIGWFFVYLTEEGKNNYFFKNIPEKFITFHWHNDTFTIPAGAKHIAYSKGCKNQAFVYGKNIVGLQFHPEVKEKTPVIFIKRFGKDLKEEKYVQSKRKMTIQKAIIKQNHKIIKKIIESMLVL